MSEAYPASDPVTAMIRSSGLSAITAIWAWSEKRMPATPSLR